MNRTLPKSIKYKLKVKGKFTVEYKTHFPLPRVYELSWPGGSHARLLDTDGWECLCVTSTPPSSPLSRLFPLGVGAAVCSLWLCLFALLPCCVLCQLTCWIPAAALAAGQHLEQDIQYLLSRCLFYVGQNWVYTPVAAAHSATMPQSKGSVNVASYNRWL